MTDEENRQFLRRRVDQLMQDKLKSIEESIARIKQEAISNTERRYIRAQLQRMLERKEMMTSVKKSALGWLVVTVLGSVGLGIWEFFKTKFGRF